MSNFRRYRCKLCRHHKLYYAITDYNEVSLQMESDNGYVRLFDINNGDIINKNKSYEAIIDHIILESENQNAVFNRGTKSILADLKNELLVAEEEYSKASLKCRDLRRNIRTLMRKTMNSDTHFLTLSSFSLEKMNKDILINHAVAYGNMKEHELIPLSKKEIVRRIKNYSL